MIMVKYEKSFPEDISLLHVLIGEDDYSLRQALADIKRGIGDPAALMPNTTVLDGKTVTPEQLRNACETVPFLAEKRLVVVEGLLERFEPPRKNGRKKAYRQAEQAEDMKKFVDIARTLPPFTELVFIGGNIKATNPLLRELSTTVKVESFPMLKLAQLSPWIGKRVKQAGGSISPPAVAVLIRFVGNDLWTMANEVDKLVLYTAGRRIEEADVKAVVSYAREEKVWEMVDAVLESRGGLAQEALQQLLQQGMAPVQLLAALSWQVRTIFLVREMRASGKSRSEIQQKLGLPSDFQVRKAWEQSEKYSPVRLRELYHRLLETDVSIKTGKLEGEIALNILVAELAQRGGVAG
jgi:DNA polymerase-3 subunit delta